MADETGSLRRAMIWGVCLLALAQVVHVLDHALVQERGLEPLTAETQAIGIVGYLTTLAVLLLVLRRDALAPLACVALGASFVLGTVVVHVLPHFSAFSDPYPDLDLGVASWLAMLILPATGLYLAWAGARAMRAGRPASATA